MPVLLDSSELRKIRDVCAPPYRHDVFQDSWRSLAFADKVLISNIWEDSSLILDGLSFPKLWAIFWLVLSLIVYESDIVWLCPVSSLICYKRRYIETCRIYGYPSRIISALHTLSLSHINGHCRLYFEDSLSGMWTKNSAQKMANLILAFFVFPQPVTYVVPGY